MPDTWGRRIQRADELAASGGVPAASFLGFYSRLLARQKYVYDGLTHPSTALTGALTRDVDRVALLSRPLLEDVACTGSDELSREARALLASPQSHIHALLTYWTAPSDRQFFAKAIVQPYAECLVARRIAPQQRGLRQAETHCPSCGGNPQVSILHSAEHESAAGGGGRLLMCATCSHTWPFRRVRCAHCGQEDEHTLSYFHAPELDHLRVDACDVCRRYIKTVDLTRQGRAVPFVDEILGAPLDVWASEHGYAKIELNLIGL
jgi:formate dehydrogenase accessory protein FdhE